MRPEPVLALLLLVVPVLAGCVDAPTTADVEADDADAPTAGGAAPVVRAERVEDARPEDVRAARYDGDAVHATLWRNDTYAPHEHALTGGLVRQHVLGEDHPHVVDVTEHLPAGVPTRITAEVTYQSNPEIMGLLGASLRTEGDVEVHDTRSTYDPGRGTLKATVTRFDGGAARIYVYGLVPDASTGIDYVLRVDVEAEPEALPPLVPTAVHVEEGGHLRFDATTENPVRAAVLVWDPEDAFVARVEWNALPARWTLPVDAPTGEYVLLLVSTRSVHVTVEDAGDADATLRSLRSEVVHGAFHDLPPEGEATWSFDVDRLPLAVGMRFEGDAVTGSPTLELSGTVASPTGHLLRFEPPYPLTMHAVRQEWWSTTGASALATGTHTATAESEASAQGRVVELLRFHVR